MEESDSSGDEDGGEREQLLQNESSHSEPDEDDDDDEVEDEMVVESMEDEHGDDNGGEGESGEGGHSSKRTAILDKIRKKKKIRKAYDKSLPAQHLYLGELDEEGVASVKEEDSTAILPLLYVPERVLFPGETLPMHIHNPHAITLLRRAFVDHQPVAVCTDLRGYSAHMDSHVRPKQSELSVIGTTADIVGCKEDEEEFYYHGPRFVVKLMGRQRFLITEVYKKMNGMMDCQIRILPEVLMAERPAHLLSCPPCVANGHMAAIIHSHQPESNLGTYKKALRARNALWSPSNSATSCPVPGWVLRMYDFDYLRECVLEAQHLQTISNDDKTVPPPADVINLSYWLARRLPVDDTSKLELLKTNCPTMRIIQGLRMLNKFTDLYCERCEAVIARKEDIFSMSVDGPLAAYVNPGGVVHDTLTVLEAINLTKYGRPTSQDSWFPGYQWTIVCCKECGDHKGWLFTAAKSDLTPKSFYGLRRPSLALFKTGKPKPNNIRVARITRN